MHDGVRRLICRELLRERSVTGAESSPPSSSPSAPVLPGCSRARACTVVTDLLLLSLTLPPHLESALTTFYLELMFDHDFKSGFGKIFIHFYEDYIDQLFVSRDIGLSLDKITVQLFTIKELTLTLMHGMFC